MRIAPLLTAACATAFLAGCGDEAEPKEVYEFRLVAQTVTLGAESVQKPLEALSTKPLDPQLDAPRVANEEWKSARNAVAGLLRQGVKRIGAHNRAKICAHPTGRELYRALGDRVATLARTLAKSREPYEMFAYALDDELIVESGMTPKFQNPAKARDAVVAALVKDLNTMLAQACRARVEQARVLLSAGDAAGGAAAAADALAIVTEFDLVGDEFDAIVDEVAKLTPPDPPK